MSNIAFTEGFICLLISIIPIIIVVVLLSTMRRSNKSTLSILSLVLGILGLVFILPLVGPIGAVISGNMALRQIRENPDPTPNNNEGLARAGIILGWIGIGFALLVVLGVLLSVTVYVASPAVVR
jgi:hypothetical protein